MKTNTNFDNVTNENVDNSTPVTPEVNAEDTNPVEPVNEPVVNDEAPVENMEQSTEASVEDTIESTTETFNTENMVRTFTISHDDILYALYNLMDASCDSYYYITDVYDTYFDYVDSTCNFKNCKRKNYSKDDATGSVQLGEDVGNIFIEKLTESEKTALDMLRNTYSSEHEELEKLREFKAEYDLAEKKALMDKWSAQISSEEAFTELQKNYSDLSLNDIEVKCKCIFADSKATFSATFSKKEKEFNPVTVNLSDNKETSKDDVYGGLFAEFGIK